MAGRGLLSGFKRGFLSNTQKRIVQGDAHADKQETLLERGGRVESSREREPRRTALPCGSQSRGCGDGISFRVVFGHSF